MYLLKVLFKLNLVPNRESWYTTKKIISENHLLVKFYTKRKRKRKKNPLLRAFLSLPLEVDKNDIWFSK